MRKKLNSESESQAAPSSPDTERSVLGAMVLDPNVLYAMQSLGLKADHFHFDSNRRIYRVIEFICSERRPFDIRILCEELNKRKELEAVGDMAYVSSLIDGVPDRSLDYQGVMQAYFGILHEHYLRRRVIEIAKRATDCAHDASDPIKWTMGGVHEDILKLQGDTVKEGELVKEFSGAVLEEITGQMYLDRTTIGIPFGIDELDEVTTGMRPGEMTLCGGYPAAGKSAFAVDVARKVSRNNAVVIFSIEMPKNDVVLRLLAQESGISYAKLRNPRHLASSERRELDAWRTSIDKLNLIIDDEARHIDEIIPRAYLYIRRHGIKLIVIDFLQLITAPGKGEYEVVSYTADALTKFAKQTKVPILALSQLTRPDDKKNLANVMPTLGMLRSSGHLEQNAHLVLFVYHPEDERGDPTGQDLILISKQRAGVKGHIKCFFDVRTQTWTERQDNRNSSEVQKDIFNAKS